MVNIMGADVVAKEGISSYGHYSIMGLLPDT